MTPPTHLPERLPVRPDLIDEKAWLLLGLTGEEFRRLWYAGAYRLDERPEVVALDHYMRSGQWEPMQPTEPGRPT